MQYFRQRKCGKTRTPIADDINYELSGFYRACRDNNIKEVKRLLPKLTLIQLHRVELNGETAVYIAHTSNNSKILRLLEKRETSLAKRIQICALQLVWDINSERALPSFTFIENTNVFTRRIAFQKDIQENIYQFGLMTMLNNVRCTYVLSTLRKNSNLTHEEILHFISFLTQACDDQSAIPIVIGMTLTNDIFQFMQSEIDHLVTNQIENDVQNKQTFISAAACLIAVFTCCPIFRSQFIIGIVYQQFITRRCEVEKYRVGMLLMTKTLTIVSTKLTDFRQMSIIKHGNISKVLSLRHLSTRQSHHEAVLLALGLFSVAKIQWNESHQEVTISLVELHSETKDMSQYYSIEYISTPYHRLPSKVSRKPPVPKSLLIDVHDESVPQQVPNIYLKDDTTYRQTSIYPTNFLPLVLCSTTDAENNDQSTIPMTDSNFQIQVVPSLSIVVRELVFSPVGTFMFRKLVLDELYMSNYTAHLSDSIACASLDNITDETHLILSVRIDELLYKFPIVHYILPMVKEEMLLFVLQQYTQSQRLNKIWAILCGQCILPTRIYDSLWKSNQSINEHIYFGKPDEINEITYNSNTYARKALGMNNAGCGTAMFTRFEKSSKVFYKRFKRNDRRFTHEFELLQDLSHFSIVSLYGTFADKDYDYLIMSYNGEALISFCPLRESESQQSRMRRVANIGFQVAGGMMYLEHKQIVHRDLHAGNILVDEHGFIRICDFGHAVRQVKDVSTGNKADGSSTGKKEDRFQWRFLAPETFLSRSETKQSMKDELLPHNFSSKSDVWAFGLLLIQLMITNPKRPYPNVDRTLIYHSI
ncbi:hypothetical protein I4U23_003928 [Adineta vaga]|nr:hypothetical protein I4U23_003928 [Adineta vaga]